MGGKVMSSDINELYRRVIYRNNTLINLLTTSRSTPGELVMCQEKLVQEAVDTLLDNGIRRQPMRDGHNEVYKLFSNVIEGKEGGFHETLLGKRVDYSGHSTIYSRQVKADELQPGVCYLQITAVDALIEDEIWEAERRECYVFLSEVYVHAFLPRMAEVKVDWKTIENAIRMIDETRTTDLQNKLEVLCGFDGDQLCLLQSLKRILEGSVAVQFIGQFSPDNSGVLSFCTAFLSGEPATRMRVQELQQLIAVLLEFMAVCKHAIRVHFRLIGEEDQEFHTQLVKGFQSLTADLFHYIPAILTQL
ncbi:hypothetical protein FNV43_RR20144 [Rhamnella rubrinervis]|uniref:DNA-directed RNA polymerase subunit n=1 Tax=Rhamnella rubrinervis TaxID=2594499 RepID=A0A8K0DVE1_9ROSA|nr:hypothetical protein FNV43_RR20144 [Rhamnella rubrinervis]